MIRLNAKRTRGSLTFDAINITILIVFSVIMLYPLLYVLSVSISDSEAVTRGRVVLFPVGFDLTAYKLTLLNSEIWSAYKNTVVYVLLGTILVLMLNTMAAYPLARRDFYGRKAIMIYFTITMFFNGGLIPTYLLINKLGMIDTIWVMILPNSVAAWNIIIFRTNFQGIPESLIESVKMDGGNAFKIYTRIVLPLSKPILATIGLFTVVGIWNNFFMALIYINDRDMIPLQNFLRNLIVQSSYDSMEEGVSVLMSEGSGKNISGLMESVKMAAIMVSLGPILLAYPFAQKYFVQGALVGSIKG